MDGISVFLSTLVVFMLAYYAYENGRRLHSIEEAIIRQKAVIVKFQESEIETTETIRKLKEEIVKITLLYSKEKDSTKKTASDLKNLQENFQQAQVGLNDKTKKLQKDVEDIKEKQENANVMYVKVHAHNVLSSKVEKVVADLDVRKEKGVVYPRWGKAACAGPNTETLYSGQVGGGHYSHQGTSVNYICLPNDPDNAQALKSHDHYNYIYGAEYEVYDYNKPGGIKSGIGQHDVACAVCFTKGKVATIMIPGRRTCYKDWTKEYEGYLMSGYYKHAAASEYACVDKDTDTIQGGSANQDGKLFYPVKTKCGSLKCPRYKGDTEVLCVVCSK